jgi:hypothetical protein
LRSTALEQLARGWKEDPKTLPIVKERATSDKDRRVCKDALAASSRLEKAP